MKITLDQIKKLLSTYRLKALRIQPFEYGYLIETSKGRKAVTVWEDGELLRWANRWREEASKLIESERFVPNVNKKRYIRYQGKYFVLSDIPEGQEPDVKNEQDCFLIGETFAKYHSTLTKIGNEKIEFSAPSNVDDQFFAQGHHWIQEVLTGIEEKEQASLLDELLYRNLPLIFKRFSRAWQLWDGVKSSLTSFPVTTNLFSLNQFVKAQGAWGIWGGYNPVLVPMHQDTVFLIREMYENSNWDLECIHSFFKGYSNYRILDENEWIYILMQVVFPWEVWTHTTEFVNKETPSEEEMEKLLEVIKRQKYWDDLAQHVGKLMDQRKQALA